MKEIEKLMEQLKRTQEKLARALPKAIFEAEKKVSTAESDLARLKAIQQMLPEQEKPTAVRTAGKKATKLRSLGEQLKAIRAGQKLSQAAAAKKAKIPQSTLCNIESGKRAASPGTIEKLTKTFSELDIPTNNTALN